MERREDEEKRQEEETKEMEALDEEIARAIVAAEEAKAAEHRTKKAAEPTKRKCSTTTKRKATLLTPSTIVIPVEQTDAFLKAFYVGVPMEFLSNQMNIDWT